MRNWDTKTADSCQIGSIDASFCQKCRDLAYCMKHEERKRAMHQMTIDEWMSQRPAQEWKRIELYAKIEWISDKNMPLCRSVNENRIMEKPDVICKGTVDGVPAYIGFKEWVSGWGEEFIEYEAIQWKEDENANDSTL